MSPVSFDYGFITIGAMRYREKFLAKPGRPVRLADIDPGFKQNESVAPAKDEIERYRQQLAQRQPLLWAEHKRSVLIVLQGLDASGKDGVVNHVLSVLNPHGAKVVSFRAPTAEETDHDFLWRIHPHAPGKGEIAIFNRSHYEDVLYPRAHKLIDKAACEKRYAEIRAFEENLAAANTLILKFLLHISKDEQLARFAARLEDPHRNWKISESDYAERSFWDDYMRAFEEALAATSTPHAPWFVIPANHKWFRNLAVSQIIADAVEELPMSYPKPSVDLALIRRKYHAALKEEKREKR
jgi:PPK2 family polyphosphate:nucleotide phosphotransferase